MPARTLIRDLMTVGVPTCKTNTPIVDIARFMIENNVEEMVVLGSEGESVGVIGYEELGRKRIERPRHRRGKKIAD
ncbi:MAG: CBS domain-containing protein [Anaerolineales bacterium]|nr:CBS domain-containing protein [Anaerolineales bacterium]